MKKKNMLKIQLIQNIIFIYSKKNFAICVEIIKKKWFFWCFKFSNFNYWDCSSVLICVLPTTYLNSNELVVL